MRAHLSLLISLLLTLPAVAGACPEVVVPVDFQDTAFKSRAWKKALRRYRDRQHRAALKALRRQSRALEKQVGRLFHVKPPKEPNHGQIQRFLKRHVYVESPGVLIKGDRFSYPSLVWWAWADCACRQGRYQEARAALSRVAQLRGGQDVLEHDVLLLVRTGRIKEAKSKLKRLPPDAYFVPYIEGLIAAAEGDPTRARRKLKQALAVSALEDRQKATKAALAALDKVESAPGRQ